MSSDHGDYAGDYGLVEKWPAGLESCLTHVPLITRVPGGKSGVVSNEMVELFDVMPTMLELAGTRATHTNFARSLLPQVHGQAGDPHRAAFSEGGYNVYEPQAFEPHLGGLYGPKTQLQNDKPELIERVASIKTKQFNFIARPSGQSELYDRSKDPAETNNLFGEHAHAPVVEQLQQRLMNWYINTSGVPEEKRDSRDMPTFDPVTPFSDVTSRAATLLDGD
jgi:choline-sulfatase